MPPPAMQTSSAGYVYILINPSMPGLIKVGRTFRDSKARARELHSTGVPTPFEVAFEAFSENHETLEKSLHEELDEFRVAGNREFFRYPLKSAIECLQALSSTPKESSSVYVAESIFHRLVEKYQKWLRQEIVDIRIVQTQERVWLEITEENEKAGYLIDRTIKQSDLAFCTGDEGRYFSPNNSVPDNAIKFIETWDPYSIIMTTDLFHHDACIEIDSNKNLNPHKRIP